MLHVERVASGDVAGAERHLGSGGGGVYRLLRDGDPLWAVSIGFDNSVFEYSRVPFHDEVVWEQFRSMRARIGALSRGRGLRTARPVTLPGRRAMLDKFEKEVDPEGKLTIQERAKRAEWARKAQMQRMALKSAAARQRRNRICQECGKPKEPEAPLCPKCLRRLREQ